MDDPRSSEPQDLQLLSKTQLVELVVKVKQVTWLRVFADVYQ